MDPDTALTAIAAARRRYRALIAFASIASLTSACLSTLGIPRTGVSVSSWVIQQPLHGQSLDLHLIRPLHPVAPDVLVLYATGAGGWYPAAKDMFGTIGAFGYPVVGVSSRTLMSIESRGQVATTSQLADDYQGILTRARSALGLSPSAPAVLTGWSRGAAFAVLVGAEKPARADILGVIAIGLAAAEELTVADDTDEEPAPSSPPASSGRQRAEVDTYAQIPKIAPRRVAIIQATNDGYLTAAEARNRFGPDSPIKRFFTVTAGNHRFKGGEEAFRESLRRALDWVVAGSPAPVFAPTR